MEVLGRIVRAERGPRALSGFHVLATRGGSRAAGPPGVVPERGMHGGLGQAGSRLRQRALEHRPSASDARRAVGRGREKRPSASASSPADCRSRSFMTSTSRRRPATGQPLEFGFDRLDHRDPPGRVHAEHAPEPPHRRPEPMHALDIPQSGRGIVDPDPSQADSSADRTATAAVCWAIGVSSASGLLRPSADPGNSIE